MADEEKKGAEEKKGGSKMILIVIIIGFVLFLAVAGAGFYILLQKMPGAAPADTVTASESAPEKELAKNEMGPVYSMKPFVINLSGDGGKRYLRVKMDIELKNQAIFDQMQAQFPRVKDKILTILSSKKFSDIETIEGKNKLRVEISEAIDTLFSKGAVVNVYLMEFVVE